MDPSDSKEGQASGAGQTPTSPDRYFIPVLSDSPEKQSSPTKQVSPAKSERPAGAYRAISKKIVDSIGENYELGGDADFMRQSTAVICPEGDNAKDVEDTSREVRLAQAGVQDRENAEAEASDGKINQAQYPKGKPPDVKVTSPGFTEDENTPTQLQFAQPPTPNGPQPQNLELLPNTVYSPTEQRPSPTLAGTFSQPATTNTSSTTNPASTHNTILHNTLITLISKQKHIIKMQKDLNEAHATFCVAQEQAVQAYQRVTQASEGVVAAEEELVRGLKARLEDLQALQRSEEERE